MILRNLDLGNFAAKMRLAKIAQAVFISLFVFFFLTRDAFASNLYLSKNNENMPYESTFSVDVVIDTNNESVNGISAFLSYSADKLEVAGISYNNGVFPIIAEESVIDGVIKISKGSFTGEIGKVTVATIDFVAKDQGRAVLSFIDGSAAPRTVDSTDSLDLNQSSGGEFTIDPPQIVSTIPACFP